MKVKVSELRKKINQMPIVFIVLLFLNFFEKYTISFILIGFCVLFQFILDLTLFKKIFKKYYQVFVLAFISLFSNIIFGITNSNYISANIEIILYYIIMIYPIFLCEKKGEEYVSDGIKGISNIVVLTAVYGIYEGILKTNPIITMFRPSWILFAEGLTEYRSYSVYMQPVIYANVLLFSFLVEFNNKKGVVSFIKILILSVAVYLTKTRTAWIMLVVMLLFYFLKECILCLSRDSIVIKKKLIAPLIFLFISAICFVNTSLFKSMIEIIIERLSSLGGSTSLSQRSGTIMVFIRQLMDEFDLRFIFGHGHEASYYFMLENRIVINNFATTDNEWISILYNYGFLILLTYLSMFVYSISLFIRSGNKFVIMITSIFIMNSIYMISWESYSNVLYRVISFFILGVLVYIIKNKKANGVYNESKGKCYLFGV